MLQLCTCCGRARPVEDMVILSDRHVCADCKDLVVQRLREGLPLPGPGKLLAPGRFTVEFDQAYEVEIWFSLWSGLEIYRVNGNEVLRQRNFAVWGKQEFFLDPGHQHRVAVASTTIPLWRTRVEIDGEPYIDELFPNLVKVSKWLIPVYLLLAVLIAFLLSWVTGQLRELWLD